MILRHWPKRFTTSSPICLVSMTTATPLEIGASIRQLARTTGSRAPQAVVTSLHLAFVQRLNRSLECLPTTLKSCATSAAANKMRPSTAWCLQKRLRHAVTAPQSRMTTAQPQQCVRRTWADNTSLLFWSRLLYRLGGAARRLWRLKTEN